MATILVSIICVAMIVVGGMSLSQGILTSADSTALSVNEITLRESEIARTGIDITQAAQLAWSDMLRLAVLNSGQTKLANFDKWDFIVRYYDASGNVITEWLPYISASPGDNEWEKARIGLNGPVEFFEPEIMNPLEEMVALAKLYPLPGDGTMMNVTMATPNGVYDSKNFYYPGYTELTPYSGNITIAATAYYGLEEATADGEGINLVQDFSQNESGRKLLYNENQASRPAKFIFPLVGIAEIPASTWIVHYRCLVSGGGQFPQQDDDVRINVDILVRQADGTVRATLASSAADVYIASSEEGTWLTKSVDYDFPGYTVVDSNDYLEIDYYAATDLGPGGETGYVQLRADDGTLDQSEQTRIDG
jgi:hypothetical protein